MPAEYRAHQMKTMFGGCKVKVYFAPSKKLVSKIAEEIGYNSYKKQPFLLKNPAFS